MTLTGRKATIVVVALIASVCLNLALAGMMVGHRWHGWDGPRGPSSWLMRGVPEEARPVVEEVVKARQAEFDAKRAVVAESRKRIAVLLQADTVDQAALEAALAEMQARLGEMFQLGQKMMVDVALKLTPEQRKEWAEKWAEERRWRRQ
jgi:Spy/CpxP family protein refolding chaperone